MSGLMQCSKEQHYSITSSAVICMISGTVRPSAFAVLRLMTSSNLVGSCTGRSAGLSPLRMRRIPVTEVLRTLGAPFLGLVIPCVRDYTINNLPPHPVAHRAQPCAILVPQDA